MSATLSQWIERVKRATQKIAGHTEPPPDAPEDPYSYVGAPVKPRLPHLSASAAAPLE